MTSNDITINVETKKNFKNDKIAFNTLRLFTLKYITLTSYNMAKDTSR